MRANDIWQLNHCSKFSIDLWFNQTWYFFVDISFDVPNEENRHIVSPNQLAQFFSSSQLYIFLYWIQIIYFLYMEVFEMLTTLEYSLILQFGVYISLPSDWSSPISFDFFFIFRTISAVETVLLFDLVLSSLGIPLQKWSSIPQFLDLLLFFFVYVKIAISTFRCFYSYDTSFTFLAIPLTFCVPNIVSLFLCLARCLEFSIVFRDSSRDWQPLTLFTSIIIKSCYPEQRGML